MTTVSVPQVLVSRPLLNLKQLDWQRATKTKPIKAKPLDQLLTDNVLEKFMLDTLEGTQTLRAGSMVCVGIGNDIWQQTKKKLFDKYNVTDVDDKGWLVCTPKPENQVNCAFVPADLCEERGFSLIGHWGEEHIIEGKKVFLQFGVESDVICQNQNDPTDVWRVARKFFDSTYDLVK